MQRSQTEMHRTPIIPSYRSNMAASFKNGQYIVTCWMHAGGKVTLTGHNLAEVSDAYDKLQARDTLPRDLTKEHVKVLEEIRRLKEQAKSQAAQPASRKVAPPPEPGHPLIGDAERNGTIEWLSEAFSDGKLRQNEFDDRMQVALGARTQPELNELTRDLGTARAKAQPLPQKAARRITINPVPPAIITAIIIAFAVMMFLTLFMSL